MNTPYERQIRFSPAWDRRSNEPYKNYGVHCVDIVFYLKGVLGVIQFSLSTGWYLPQNKSIDIRGMFPMATDIGYHSPKPLYEDQEPMKSRCDFYNPCYYDGSSLCAQIYLDTLIAEGDEAVWRMMEEEYVRRFMGENEN